jgi:hypothetical protein|tara:strand:- start:237 stop:629 length:393 start_codon:yes stop_codon:yes gene_type:complete
LKTKPYRNKFEERTAKVLGSLCEYEPYQIPYVTYRNYIPDFVGKTEDGLKTLIVEAKGFFRVGDVQKYKAIRDSLRSESVQSGETTELIFVLYNPNKKLRKGSKMNMGEWCTKEGLKWFTVENVRDAFTT